MIKPVEIITVTKIIPIFKDGQEANAITVINFSFDNGDECGYNVVSQKGLYKIGDNAVYIQPDYNLSDISLFDSFIRPNGEPNKSRLGKNNRIRAIKFNFMFETSTDPIYSFGILMPVPEVKAYLGSYYDETNLVDLLGITKYEAPENAGSGLIQGEFPSFLYSTDETTYENLKSHITRLCDGNTEMGASIKVDGSSISIYVKKIDGIWTHGICSRNQEKKIEQHYISEYVNGENRFHKYLHPETKIMGWKCDVTDEFYSTIQIEGKGFNTIKTEVKDSWVELANNSGIVQGLLEYCKKYDIEISVRGEIAGSGLKGSGNKLNPDASKKQFVILFGIDSLENGFSMRQHYGNEHNLKKVCDELNLLYTPIRTFKPTSYDAFVAFCDGIITEEHTAGRAIEGVVIRTMYTNELSTKVISKYYDSKK